MLHDDDVQAVNRLNEAYHRITHELSKVIVGQQQVIEELLIAMFARGHCLLVGVPGLAKTLMIRTLADTLSLEFSRIQFTPDLMPSDITGTEVIQEDKLSGVASVQVSAGPDLRQRDPGRRDQPHAAQDAGRAAGSDAGTPGDRRRQRHQLAEPFFVLATQNPIEQEGTYPLPEAQLDRFMFNIFVDYPDEEEELRDRAPHDGRHAHNELTPTLSAEEILALQQIVRRCRWPITSAAMRCKFTRLTRREKGDVPDFVQRLRELGGRAAGQPVPGAGRQGPGRAARPLLRQLRRHPRGGRRRAAASHRDQLQRRGRRDQARRYHPQLIDIIPSPTKRRVPVENYQKYLDPQTLASLQGLELRARLIVEGYVSGVHRSPYHGFSIEFAEHREYVPGDDLRYVDWKVFGKTDKFYLKQYEEETNLVCYLLLGYQREHALSRATGAPMSKLEYAQCIAGVAGLPDPAAARQRRPGDVRQGIAGAWSAPAAIRRT